MIVLKLVCIASLALVAYSYIGYPILLMLYARLIGSRQSEAADQRRSSRQWPYVSLVIAAYREERVILERVHNALLMDYPADRIEIIIGCDGKEDATGDLVRLVNDSRVRLAEFPERRGKPSVLNDCVALARGEIIAFSDANTFFRRDALKALVRHFDSPGVGGVVGRLDLVDPDSGENLDGQFWKMESILKRCEGRIGALLGANGAIYAVRKSLWQPISANTIVDDFLIGMRVHLRGRQLLFEPDAVAVEESAPSLEAEFQRRCRIGAGAFQSLVWLAPLLSPKFGRIAWAFWSHKVLRWFAPVLLALGLAANIPLCGDIPFRVLLAIQLVIYGAALIGIFVPGHSRAGRFMRMGTMFLSMNAALAVGLWRWLNSTQTGTWKRTVRSAELAASKTKCPEEYTAAAR